MKPNNLSDKTSLQGAASKPLRTEKHSFPTRWDKGQADLWNRVMRHWNKNHEESHKVLLPQNSSYCNEQGRIMEQQYWAHIEAMRNR